MYILGTFVGLLAIIMMLRAEPLHPRFGSIALATISSILILPYLLPLSVPFAGHVFSLFTFPLNPPAWSLIFELGANGLYSVLRPKSRLWFVAAIAISYYLTVTSTVASSAPGGPDSINIFGGIFRAIFSFFAGVLLWEVWNSKDAKIIQFDLGPLPACLTLVVICSIPYSKIEFLVLILSIVPLTVWLATSNPRSAAASALFRVLGKVAYPIYSIHWPAYQVAQLCKGVIRGIPPNSPLSYASSLVLAAAVILVAYLLVIFYDQPLRRRLSEFRWLDWPTSVVN
jgi:peptidoglycan/LPS O-acetylase OafA/YrhL